MTVAVLSIAGSDSGGGAGIQADLKTFMRLGVWGVTAVTALTAQNTRGVAAVEAASPAMLRRQIDCLFADMDIRAVKIGMLPTPRAVETAADALAHHRAAATVLDPVLVSTSGHALAGGTVAAALAARLFPLSLCITPNLPEAAALLGEGEATDLAGMAEQGRRLLALGARAVLMKGGHLAGGRAVDLLVGPQGETAFDAPRLSAGRLHGTGCTLSSAIAAYLALGRDLVSAVGAAKAYVSAAIEGGAGLSVGGGLRCLDHRAGA